MANKDYEQKKRECLQEFCKLHDCETPHDYIVETFDYAFNRAYALGKEKETITQEEIEKAAENYVENNPFVTPYTVIATRESFKDGANFALGKQEKDAEDTVIQGWVARDEDGDLRIYREMPKRSKREGMWDGNIAQIVPSPLLFPDFTWDSDPEPVEIIIKRKKNG